MNPYLLTFVFVSTILVNKLTWLIFVAQVYGYSKVNWRTAVEEMSVDIT